MASAEFCEPLKELWGKFLWTQLDAIVQSQIQSRRHTDPKTKVLVMGMWSGFRAPQKTNSISAGRARKSGVVGIESRKKEPEHTGPTWGNPR